MYKQRIKRVLDALARQGLDQMIVSDPYAIWYLTGVDVEPLERMFALYLSSTGNHKLFMNRLFPVPDTDIDVVWMTDTDDQIALVAASVDGTRDMGIDKLWPARFLLPLMAKHPGVKYQLASDCVDNARAIKDEQELKLMREASRINDLVMEKAAAFIHAGVTEKEVADYIASQYAAEGCEGLSFPTIVSFGGHGADPHHMPDDTVLKSGDGIVIDMGCRKDRYCSDMTRTFFWESADPEFAAIHDLVRSANEAAEALIRPGVALRDLDAAARDKITAAGYGEYFTHRLGHFIGQTDHEQGDVSSSSPIIAQPGMIFSIEPGVYLPGRFGVRVEDLVLVTEDGYEPLNKVDKHWRCLK